LAYLPVSPDTFIRRKLIKKFGKSPFEPIKVEIRDNTAWSDWHINNISLGRWTGNLDSNAEYKLVDENHPYTRYTVQGKVEEGGPQCWKIAFNEATKRCVRIVKGDSKTMKGGMLEVLADLIPSKDSELVKSNVLEYLIHYSLIYWREYFLHQGYTEPDIYLPDIANKYLLKGTKKKSLSDKECIIAGIAAQAYYFALEGIKSTAAYWENFDQRALYQNVMHITLAMARAIIVYTWLRKPEKAKKVIETLKEELIGFENAYDRYNLADYGVTKSEWNDSIKSVIEDSQLNIVERTARRISARHLRPIGFRKEFSLEDENIATSTGHLWSGEVDNVNFKWENKFFCGIKEE